MSNRQLEERAEEQQAAVVAAALDISVEELALLDWSIDELSSDDGHPYGCIVTFGDNTPDHILARLGGQHSGRLARIIPLWGA